MHRCCSSQSGKALPRKGDMSSVGLLHAPQPCIQGNAGCQAKHHQDYGCGGTAQQRIHAEGACLLAQHSQLYDGDRVVEDVQEAAQEDVVARLVIDDAQQDADAGGKGHLCGIDVDEAEKKAAGQNGLQRGAARTLDVALDALAEKHFFQHGSRQAYRKDAPGIV